MPRRTEMSCRLSVESLEVRETPAALVPPAESYRTSDAPASHAPALVAPASAVVVAPGVAVGGWYNHNETFVRAARRKSRRK